MIWFLRRNLKAFYIVWEKFAFGNLCCSNWFRMHLTRKHNGMFVFIGYWTFFLWKIITSSFLSSKSYLLSLKSFIFSRWNRCRLQTFISDKGKTKSYFFFGHLNDKTKFYSVLKLKLKLLIFLFKVGVERWSFLNMQFWWLVRRSAISLLRILAYTCRFNPKCRLI